MKFFFKLLQVFLVFLLFGFFDISHADDDSDYEKYYPQYVDSKEPLSTLKFKDIQVVKKSSDYLRLQLSLPTPITFPYGSLRIQQLDIYGSSGKGLKPVIFFIHAGYVDKSEVLVAVKDWLSLGYAVVSINHRVVPDNSFPEMVDDVNTALKWVMKHIQNYGGDPNRIAITGLSCGAHLAALLVTDTASQQKYGIEISKVKCWFPMSGFYDLDLKENLISTTIKRYIGWISVPSKRDASPVALITGKEPPCLILHGGDDWAVPKTNALSLSNRLDKEKATLAILKGYTHSAIFYSYYKPDDEEPAILIKRFLVKHLPTERNH